MATKPGLPKGLGTWQQRAQSGNALKRGVGTVITGQAGVRPTSAQNDAWRFYTSQTGPMSPGGNKWTSEGWNAFRDAYVPGGGQFTMPASPFGPGGGSSGGGRGGGGGGGGGSGITQAMIDAMAKALGASGGQLQLQQAQLPAFQGQELGAFDASPYTLANSQIDTAVGADQANIATNQQAVTDLVRNNYTNAYANAPVTQNQQVMQPGANLMGGMVQPGAAQQVNAQGQNSQAGFQNLLSVLAAADQTAQNSRMNQVGMDANYARQNLGAAATGMRGGLAQSQAQAQKAWQQQAAERQYQNSLMQQQWQREAMMRQQDLANQQAQANWTQQNSSIQSRLQPILDLISQSGGQAGINLAPLYQALGVQ